VPVGDAHALYARRHNDAVKLLVLPGEHDATDELERHSDALVTFLRGVFDTDIKRIQ
jgi:hypothetical protein